MELGLFCRIWVQHDQEKIGHGCSTWVPIFMEGNEEYQVLVCGHFYEVNPYKHYSGKVFQIPLYVVPQLIDYRLLN